MITMMGSIPYPPMADASPILALAADLKQMSAGLGQGSSQLTGTASTAQSSWVGQAAQAFLDTMAKRSATIDQIAQFIGGAAVPLQTFGAAIQTTSAAYSAAAVAERAAEAGLPWTAAALAAALAEEAAAVLALEAAGVACATALAVIEAKVAAAEYGLAHLGRNSGTTPSRTAPPPASPPAQTPTAQTPTAPNTTAPAPVAPPAATSTGDGDLVHVLEELVGALHHGLVIAEGEIDGFVKGMEQALEQNRAAYTRNGQVLERWAANRGGPTTGLTYRQATAAVESAERWSHRVAAVGLVVDGVHQVMEDNHNASLTTTQRVGRTSAAVLVQGGGGMLGAGGGASVGAEIGALVGVFFGGVGAVPGAVIGGFIGGVVGGYYGTEAGKAAKEQLFESNPGGAFR